MLDEAKGISTRPFSAWRARVRDRPQRTGRLNRTKSDDTSEYVLLLPCIYRLIIVQPLRFSDNTCGEIYGPGWALATRERVRCMPPFILRPRPSPRDRPCPRRRLPHRAAPDPDPAPHPRCAPRPSFSDSRPGRPQDGGRGLGPRRTRSLPPWPAEVSRRRRSRSTPRSSRDPGRRGRGSTRAVVEVFAAAAVVVAMATTAAGRWPLPWLPRSRPGRDQARGGVRGHGTGRGRAAS